MQYGACAKNLARELGILDQKYGVKIDDIIIKDGKIWYKRKKYRKNTSYLLHFPQMAEDIRENIL